MGEGHWNQHHPNAEFGTMPGVTGGLGMHPMDKGVLDKGDTAMTCWTRSGAVPHIAGPEQQQPWTRHAGFQGHHPTPVVMIKTVSRCGHMSLGGQKFLLRTTVLDAFHESNLRRFEDMQFSNGCKE